MHDDVAGANGAGKLPWVTPRLELLGSMRDVKADAPQPSNDLSGSPAFAAS